MNKKPLELKGVVIGLDFDGTCVVHRFPEVGADVPGAVEVLREIVASGGQIVLNTMRCSGRGRDHLDEALGWFDLHNIPLFGINENPGQRLWTKSPKVYAHIYIDDAALGCPLTIEPGLTRPYVNWPVVRHLLSNYTKLNDVIHQSSEKIVTE